MTKEHRVLIIDDDPSLAAALVGLLEHEGYGAGHAPDGSTALEVIGKEPIGLALLDVRLGRESGLELLPRLKTLRPEMSVIVITAAGTVEMAVEAMRKGADNFILKPVDPPQLLAIVAKGIEAWSLRRRSLHLERLVSRKAGAILGESAGMQRTLELAGAVADRDTTVLLLGETGTGKGLLALHIHDTSSRRKQPFVELNCAGLSRDLTESELFGHEKGAFTGAAEKKIGLFEAADGGTLVLDEIGEMDPAVQAKLLKVLESRRFRRVGGTAEIEVDVRLLAATHRDLEREASDGNFREDLFYRLNVFAIPLPPLRDRAEDVLDLAVHFLREFQGGDGAISDDAAGVLRNYGWPGNVRELRNVMERAAILCPRDSAVLPSHLPRLDGAGGSAGSTTHDESPGLTTLRDAERRLLEQALRNHDGNVLAAARELGISRGTLYRKAKKYGISLESGPGGS